MNGVVNGFSINGTALPSWVVRAVVVASAATSVATATPIRTTFAAAHGDAAVSVSLTQTHVIQARASGFSSVSSSTDPSLVFSGACVATAHATGNGAVRRDVYATAGGDATCSAVALTAQAVGEATAHGLATVDRAQAHIIYPAKSLTVCEALGIAAADVTRFTSVDTAYGSTIAAWGEASIKRNGSTHFDHDGYSVAHGLSTSLVDQHKTKIVATLGAFDFGNSTAQTGSFIIYTARASGGGVASAQPATATHIYRPSANAEAHASIDANATRVVMASASSSTESVSYGPRACVRYVAEASGAAYASVDGATATRMAMAQQTGATAGAVLAEGIVFGMQHWAAVDAAESSGIDAIAFAGVIFSAVAHGDLAVAVSLESMATRILQGHVDDVAATALVGRAFALTNSEIRAPDDRYMIVPMDDRAMFVLAENRLMVVTV